MQIKKTKNNNFKVKMTHQEMVVLLNNLNTCTIKFRIMLNYELFDKDEFRSNKDLKKTIKHLEREFKDALSTVEIY